MSARGWAVALLVLLGGGVAGLAVYQRRPVDPASPPPGPIGGARILVSGEHLGELEPCGCARPMRGGVQGRAALIARLTHAARPPLLIDTGNLVGAPGRQQELKYATFIAALRATGYAAAAVGPRDLLVGMDVLRDAAADAGFPLLAANLLDRDGARPFPSHVALPMSPDGALVVVGLLPSGAAESLGDGSRVAPPVEALRALRAELDDALSGGGALLVVGGFDGDVARALASAAWRPTTVIHGRGALPPTDRASEVGAAQVLGIGGRGHHLLELDHRARLTRLHEIEGDVEVAPLVTVLAAYQGRLRAEDLLGRVARLPAASAYVGSAACQPCHAEPHATWAGTAHAKAMQSLVRSGHQHDPECVTCHVVGFDRRGGFGDAGAAPGLDRVGCEACHGPGGAHVANPVPRSIDRSGPRACAGCHTKDHDPHFEHKVRWPKIAH